jgi:molybdate transport system substrate-binding protein
MRAHRRAAVLAIVVLGLSGCGGSTAGEDRPLTVFAAASLTDVFTELAGILEDREPGVDVRLTFAGSSALAAQLLQGAPADVFASADEAQMARVADAGLVEGTDVFAVNPLVIAVPPGNPGDVADLTDFAREELRLAVCAPEVPCGAAAATVFASAGVEPVPDTYEEDVRAALTKVQLGEVDAALVYLTDAFAAGDSVEPIAFREADQALNRYPIGVLADAPHPDAAQAFVDLLLSDTGRRVLDEARFHQP